MTRFVWLRFVLPLLLICGAAGTGWWRSGGRWVVDSSAGSLLASDPRNLETYQKVNELIPDTEMVLIALEMDGIFSDRGAHILARTSQLLRKLDGCVEVKSLTHSGRPVRKGFRLEIEPFIPLRASPEEWERIRAFTTEFPLSRNTLVSEDARYAILIGVFERPLPDLAAKARLQAEVEGALSEARSVVKQVHVLAFPFLEVEGVKAVRDDLKRYGMAAGGLILLVLLGTFRNPVLVLAVGLWEAAGMGLLWTAFQLFDHPVDVYTGILFPLVGGLQLTFVVHYLAALQRFGRGGDPSGAAVRAFREVAAPSALAALTTIAGLLTLAFSGLPTLEAFGRIGSVAVAFAFAATFLLPALVGLRRGAFPDPRPTRTRTRFHKVVAVPLAALMFAATLLIAPGILDIRTDIRAVEFIKRGHPVRESIELLNRDLGGTNIFQVRVDTGRPRGLQTLPVLRFLEELRGVAVSLEGVTDAYAYSQLYMGLNQIWEGGSQTQATLPNHPAKLAMFSQLINASPLLFKESFVDDQAQSALMILRSRDMPAKQYLALLETFMAEAEARAPEGVTLTPVNGLHTLLEGDRRIVRSQVKTLAWTVGVIGLLLAAMWRSVKLAGVVLAANLPALVTIFGGMGLSGFPLNSITVMVAAVILGIAVDDGIHLVGAFRHHLRTGQAPDQAAAAALREKLKPMACTSAILAVFLGLLVLTSFPPVAHFGILGAAGIGAAFLGAALLLPSLLVLTHR